MRSAHSPAWSPDGKRLALIVLVDARGQLAVVDADGQNAAIIRTGRIPDPNAYYPGFSVDSPAWSPDGSRIAFVQRYCGGNVLTPGHGVTDDACRPDTRRAPDDAVPWSELRSISPTGAGEQVIVAASDTFNESPSWSPSGAEIVFARAANAPEADWDLYTVSSNGSSMRAVVQQPVVDAYDPAWSPSGEWIAFTASYAGQSAAPQCGTKSSGIALITPDARFHPAVTSGRDACDSEPAWGPDDSWLLFTRRYNEVRQVGELWATSTDTATSPRRIGPGHHGAVRPGP